MEKPRLTSFIPIVSQTTEKMLKCYSGTLEINPQDFEFGEQFFTSFFLSLPPSFEPLILVGDLTRNSSGVNFLI